MTTRLITGCTGTLGNVLVRYFLSNSSDDRLFLFGRSDHSCSFEKRVQQSLSLDELQRVTCLEGDLRKARVLSNLKERIDEVWHAGAFTDLSDRFSSEIYSTNIDGTRQILEFTQSHPKTPRFFYISTAYVVGKRSGESFEDELDVGQAFHNTYERSKLHAEFLVRDAFKKGLSGAIFRPSILVGDSETGEISRFDGIYRPWKAVVFAKQQIVHFNSPLRWKDRMLHIPFQVIGREETYVNIIPVNEAVSLMTRLAESSSSDGKTFHITNPQDVTIGVLRDEICSYLGITGLDLVDRIDHPTQLERLFYRQMQAFTPYMSAEAPRFNQQHVRDVLGDFSVSPPDISLMNLLLTYADRAQWGSEKAFPSFHYQKLPQGILSLRPEKILSIPRLVSRLICGKFLSGTVSEKMTIEGKPYIFEYSPDLDRSDPLVEQFLKETLLPTLPDKDYQRCYAFDRLLRIDGGVRLI